MENLSNFDNSTIATELTRSKGGIVTDEHQFPFSLFNAIKHNNSVKMTTAGDVSEVMDKTIGRIVYKIKGSVSANNYLSVENFVLLGPILYIQYCLLKPNIATIHLEVVTISNMSFRISLSTLYDNDVPKFLGRSLRMPLPLVSGWISLEIDIKRVLTEFCGVLGQQNPHHKELKHIKKVQICSNMVIRDVISSDRSVYVDGKTNTKELIVKPQCEQVPCVDLVEYCNALQHGHRNQFLTDRNIDIHLHPVQSPTASPAGHLAKSPSSITPLKNSKFSPFNKSGGEKKREERPTTASKGKTVVESSTLPTPATPADENKNYALAFADSTAATPIVSGPTPPPPPPIATTAMSDVFNKSELDTTIAFDPAASLRGGSKVNFSNIPPNNGSIINTSTPLKSTIRSPIIPTSEIIKYNRITANPNERILKMERILGYRGGPAVLLYQGRMLVYSAGAHLVMVDLCKSSPEISAPKIPTIGLWKAFGADFGNTSEGYKQAFLKGHTDEIGLIEISASEQYMATAEKSKENPLVIIWDIKEGNRIASFRPYKHDILSISFHHYLSQIVTVGLDSQFRHQIIIWDIRNLTLQKGVVTNAEALQTCTIAKQISEFSITKISYIPFINQNSYEENNQLISCGRENIRLWRVRKQHLPGRPILLNDYSRGYSFTEIAFDTVTTAATATTTITTAANGMRSPTSTAVITPTPNVTAPLINTLHESTNQKKGIKPLYYIYVASNHGLILRINYITEQILCAFQLHASPIRSFRIQNGYSVTGGEDSKLRIWPLDFQDFLLEARHEGAVTNLYINNDGKQQIIGTNAGTLGLLNVLEHSYETILRSHTAAITQVQYNNYPSTGTSHSNKSPTASREIVTIGKDRTIRIWDIQSASQNVEFLSEMDEPACVAFHPNTLPNYHSVVVGFQSGILRVFDVTSALSILERKIHAYPIIKLEVFTSMIEKGKVYCCTVDNHGYLMIHEIVNHQQLVPVANVHITNHTFESLLLSIHPNTAVLAVGYDTVESIQLFRIPDLLPFSPLSPLPAYVSTGVATTNDADEDQQKKDDDKQQGTSTPTKSYNELFGKTTTTTFRSGYNSASPNSPSHNALQSPLIGMCFLTDETPVTDNRMTLLITTEKHFYVFSMIDPYATAANLGMTTATTTSMMNPSINPSLQWEQRASKRIDFGVPTSMQRDPKTGLIGLAIKVPVFGNPINTTTTVSSTLVATNSSHSTDAQKSTTKTTANASNIVSTTKINENAFNSFALLNIKFMKSEFDYKQKLYFSVPQIYQGLPGDISDIAFCFPYLKVITADQNGCMTFWKIQEEQCARLLQDSSLSLSNALTTTQDKVIPMQNKVVAVVSQPGSGKELDDYIPPRDLTSAHGFAANQPDRYIELVTADHVDFSASLMKSSKSTTVKPSNQGNDFAFMFEEEDLDTPPPPPPSAITSSTRLTAPVPISDSNEQVNRVPVQEEAKSLSLNDIETVKKESESIDESIQKVQSLFSSLKLKTGGESNITENIVVAAKADEKKVLDLTDLYNFDKKIESKSLLKQEGKEINISKPLQGNDFEIRKSSEIKVLPAKDNFDHLFGDDDDVFENDDGMTSHHILSSYDTMIARRETVKEIEQQPVFCAPADNSSRISGSKISDKRINEPVDPLSQIKLDIYTPPIHCPTAKVLEKFKLLRSITSNTSAGYPSIITDVEAPQLVFGNECITDLVLPPNRFDFAITTDGKSIFYHDLKTNQQYTVSCRFPSIFPMHEIKQLVCQVTNLAIAPASQGVAGVIYLPSKNISLLCYWKLVNQLLVPYSILPLDLKNDPVLKSERAHSVAVDYSQVAFVHNDLIMLIQGSKSQGSTPPPQVHQQNTTNVAYQMFQLSVVQIQPNFVNVVLCQHRLTIPGNGIHDLHVWYTSTSVYGILHTSSSCVVVDVPIAANDPSQLRQAPRVIWLDDLKSHGQFLGKAFTACKATSPGSTSDSIYTNKGILVAVTSLGTLHISLFDTIADVNRSSVTFAGAATITRSKLITRTTEITLPVINTLTLAEVIKVDIQEIADNHYHLAISLDDKLHLYLLKVKELSKKSIQAAMFNHQQTPLPYVPMNLSFYHPNIQLKRSSKPTKFPVPLILTANNDCNMGLIGNTSNHFPMINSRNYFEIRSPVPTMTVKGIIQMRNLDDEELVVVVTSTHLHPYHAVTGLRLPSYAFREGFRCTTIATFGITNSSATDTVTKRPWIAIGCTNGHVLLYNAHTFEEIDSWTVYAGSILSSPHQKPISGTTLTSSPSHLVNGELMINGKRMFAPSMLSISSSGQSIAALSFTTAHASSKELIGLSILTENGDIFFAKLVEVTGNVSSDAVVPAVSDAPLINSMVLKYVSHEIVSLPPSTKIDIPHAMESHHHIDSFVYASLSLAHPSHQSIQAIVRKPIGVIEIIDTPYISIASNTYNPASLPSNTLPTSSVITRRLFIRALLPAYNQEEALIPSSYFPTDEQKLLEQTDTLMIDAVHISDWSTKQWLITIIGKFAHISISKDTWLFSTTINHSSLMDVKHSRDVSSMSYDAYDAEDDDGSSKAIPDIWESYVYLSKRVNIGPNNTLVASSFYQQYAAIWVSTQQIYLLDLKVNQGKKDLMQSIDQAAFRVMDLSSYSFGLSSAPPLEMAFHNKLLFYAKQKVQEPTVQQQSENTTTTTSTTTTAAPAANQEYYLLLSEFARPSKLSSIKIGSLPY